MRPALFLWHMFLLPITSVHMVIRLFTINFDLIMTLLKLMSKRFCFELCNFFKSSIGNVFETVKSHFLQLI